MFYRLFLAAPLALLACAPINEIDAAPTSVDAEGAAQAAVASPQLAAVAQALNAQKGTKLSEASDLTIVGAEADGDRLNMSFQHAQPSTAFGPAAREGYQIVAERSIRQNFCTEPALARFVETYGVSANIVTSDGQPLATVTVEDC